MDNKEAIKHLTTKLNIYYFTDEDNNALDQAIKALEFVEAVKDCVNKHQFPEYLKDHIITVVERYYNE